MKKFLKIIGIIFAVIIILMIVLPLFFKGEIENIVKTEINKKINATLNFSSVGLNMFEHFPDFTLSIDNISVVNKAPFEGDTLMSANSFSTTIDLWKAVFGGHIVIKGLSIEKPNIFVYVLKDSSANYNIYESAAASADTSKSNFNVALQSYSIDNANIAYIDQTSGMVVAIKNLNHSGSGDFTQDNFNINTKTTIDELTFENKGITYLNRVTAALNLTLNADVPSKKFTLKENELSINNLKLKFDGSVQAKEKSTIINLKFESPQTDFKDFISLIPAIYSQNFNDLKASGKLSFGGNVDGTYRENQLPEFNLSLKVNNGMFQYPKLPTPVNNVNIDLAINNPGGNPDNTIIDIKKFHLELGKEPFDAKVLIKQPQSGPFVDASIKGKINLSQLKDAVHLENVSKLEGIINTDFSLKGNIAAVKNKQYENINASGNISISNLLYDSKNSPEAVKITSAFLNLTPKSFKLSNFNMSLGNSDLKASGDLNNVVSYVLSNGTLDGRLNLSSNYFDVNPFMSNGEKKADTSKMQAVDLPENITFTANASFKKLIYDNLTLDNVKGTIELKNQRLNLNNLTANLLGGSFAATGYYDTKSEKPEISFSMNINKFNVQNTYKSFVTVKQFVPMAQYVQGTFSSKLNLTSTLTDEMIPNWDSFNSKGSLDISHAEVNGFKPFQLIGDKLKISELSNPTLNNIATSYKIENGRFYLSPVKYKVSNYDVTLAGSNGIDKSLDYNMGINIPAGKLKSNVNQAVSGLLKKNINVMSSNNVKVDVLIKGQIDSPSLSFSGGETAKEVTKQVQETVKQEVKQKVEEKKQEVQKQAEQKVDTVKKQLEKKAEKKIKDLFKKFK
ncbi:MAG: AsmA-like C-terminal region-containing protein [Ignavibacteriaceae bacterium]